MGGSGYSDESEWETLFHDSFTSARFTTMNENVARKINMAVTGKPGTDVGSTYTYAAKAISDDMIATYAVFLKEYSMESPPEFIHYKLPHFTPMHLSMINMMKKQVRVGKVVF